MIDTHLKNTALYSINPRFSCQILLYNIATNARLARPGVIEPVVGCTPLSGGEGGGVIAMYNNVVSDSVVAANA